MNKEILHSAVNFLARREHSEKELVNKLKSKEYAPDEISVVIEHLIAKDYLSDQRFADSVFRYRLSRGFGWRYIQNELQQKGVSAALIKALGQEQETDWYHQAELAYNKRFALKEIKDQKDKAKRIRFLQYRGFSIDEIMAVLQTD
ncbi:regulatory protein RecX [Thalassomonas haliotis]|uniref:Regulatory protein RecX n=1 Tax=Thalassomonas haliotis TaxID=485448 RepID=A0ABY7VDD3_9GAMM|nr:regulatory protein RecX [Thalassomonas haliotis]WDE10902.1 regulatory protein RecX [Thalassomonas haliotis]